MKLFTHKKLRLVLAALLLLAVPGAAQAVGVQPLVVDLDMSPGDSQEFELLLNPGESEETVHLSLFKPEQLLTGSLAYQEADGADFDAASWVELDDDTYTVPPEENVVVTGSVDVPFDAEGSHTVVVMVEPEQAQDDGQIAFEVRYAVRINIDIDRPGMRPALDIGEFSLEPDEDTEAPRFQALVENTSALRYPVSAEVTVRDESRQLIERVSLRPQAAWDAQQENSTLYPHAEVEFFGLMDTPLYPGDYEARLFLRYADGRQSIENKTLTVSEGQFGDYAAEALLAMDPESITSHIQAGASASEVIEIENQTPDAKRVRLSLRDVEPEYAHSVLELMDVELRGDSEFVLDGRSSGRNVLMVRSDRDIEEGGYYGYLDVESGTDADGILDTETIPLAVIVGDDLQEKGNIESIDYTEGPDGTMFSVSVGNTGTVHMAPEGTLYLRDDEGSIAHSLPLELQEGTETILPKQGDLLVTPETEIEHKVYEAEVVLEAEDQELDRIEEPLELED